MTCSLSLFCLGAFPITVPTTPGAGRAKSREDKESRRGGRRFGHSKLYESTESTHSMYSATTTTTFAVALIFLGFWTLPLDLTILFNTTCFFFCWAEFSSAFNNHHNHNCLLNTTDKAVTYSLSDVLAALGLVQQEVKHGVTTWQTVCFRGCAGAVQNLIFILSNIYRERETDFSSYIKNRVNL